jgi:hypothetical protein
VALFLFLLLLLFLLLIAIVILIIVRQLSITITIRSRRNQSILNFTPTGGTMVTSVRLRDFWRRAKMKMGFNPYLCPSCKWNNPRDCRHRNRPYATICEDYRKR